MIHTKSCPACGALHKGFGDYCCAHAHLEGRITARPTGAPILQQNMDSLGFVVGVGSTGAFREVPLIGREG